MSDPRLRPGSVVELPGGRVGTLKRRARGKKMPGIWWSVLTLSEQIDRNRYPSGRRLEVFKETDMKFIYQEYGS
jgi:hypothetical protein